MRHTASGMAIPDFPTMGGLWIPTFSESMLNNINVDLFDMDWDMVSRNQVIIHFIHRFGALIVSTFIGKKKKKNNSVFKTNNIYYFSIICFWCERSRCCIFTY